MSSAFRRVSLKAVIVGGIVDVGLTYAMVVAVAIGSILPRLTVHSSTEPGPVYVAAGIALPMLALMLCVGGACSLLGGYVAARLAKHDELLNGALSVWLYLLVGVLSLGIMPKPTWEMLSTDLSAPLLGLLGGYLRMLQRSRSDEP